MKSILKKLAGGALIALLSLSALATTLSPVSLLNPSGSTSGQAILSTGATTAPAWGSVSITALSGTLPIANGGTNATTASAALTSLGAAPSASPTLTGTPVAPTAAAATNTTQLATTAFVLANCTGVGQTFTTETGSRTSGTTYTNSTGRPIVVYVAGVTTVAAGTLFATINGTANVATSSSPNISTGVGLSVVIPAGATYSVTGASATIAAWFELR